MQFSSRILFVILALGLLLISCGRKPMHVVSAETEMLVVDSSLNSLQDSDYLALLAPVKADIEAQLNIVIGHAPEAMEPRKPESLLLNWAADALLFPMRAQAADKADFSVVNVGGLRCSWAAGDITIRNVYELMPFDNEVVILSLKGEDVLTLAEQCAVQGGQGVSGLTLEIANGHAQNVRVQGKEVKAEAIYHVITSDYLSGGADGLDALTHFTEREMTGIKIRELYIDYIRQLTLEGKPVQGVVDGRIRVL